MSIHPTHKERERNKNKQAGAHQIPDFMVNREYHSVLVQPAPTHQGHIMCLAHRLPIPPANWRITKIELARGFHAYICHAPNRDRE